MSQNLDFLKKISFFKGVDKKTLEKLSGLGKVIELYAQKGDLSEFKIEDKIYFLINGGILLSCIDQNGKKVISENLEKGSFFGHLNVSTENPHDMDCWFMEPLPKSRAVIYEFKREDFLNLLYEDRLLAVRLIMNLSKRISMLEHKIETLALHDIETRLLEELIKLGKPEKEYGGFRIKVDPTITHEKLAQSIGTVRETVSKTIAKLKKLRIIFYDKNKNIVINLIENKRYRFIKKSFVLSMPLKY